MVRLISVRAGSRSFRGLRIPDVLRWVVVLGPRSGGGWGGAGEAEEAGRDKGEWGEGWDFRVDRYRRRWWRVVFGVVAFGGASRGVCGSIVNRHADEPDPIGFS